MKTVRFEDLTKDVQRKVIERQINENVNSFDATEWFPQIIEKCAEKGFIITCDDISYDLCGFQGSGLSFTGQVDIKKFLEAYHYKASLVTDIDFVEIKRSSSNYVHEKTVYLEFDDDYTIDDIPFLDYIDKKRIELCKDFFTLLDDSFADISMFDPVKENIIDENLWWTIDGEESFNDKPTPTYDLIIDLSVKELGVNILEKLTKDDILQLTSFKMEKIILLNDLESITDDETIIIIQTRIKKLDSGIMNILSVLPHF